MKKHIQKQQDINQINIIELTIFTIIMILISMAICLNVKAQTYTNDSNIYENTYINQLIDMAVNQEKDIETKKYAIIQIQYDYYLFIFNDYSISGNRINANNTTIYKAIRTQNNYNYYYVYSKSNESNTIINANYLTYTNTEIGTSMENNRISEYNQKERIKKAIIFIIAIIFVIMLLKGRDRV